ncbi:RIMS-binding protein 2 isoform X1 [Tachysurus ichikawai]
MQRSVCCKRKEKEAPAELCIRQAELVSSVAEVRVPSTPPSLFDPSSVDAPVETNPPFQSRSSRSPDKGGAYQKPANCLVWLQVPWRSYRAERFLWKKRGVLRDEVPPPRCTPTSTALAPASQGPGSPATRRPRAEPKKQGFLSRGKKLLKRLGAVK